MQATTSQFVLVRGPLLEFALLVFIAGMAYRLARILLLGWQRDKTPPKGSAAGGIVKSYAKGLLVLPFWPWVKGTFVRNPVTYLAGALFHFSLFVVVFLGTAHMLAWKSLLGFGWPTLPTPVIDWLSAGAIFAMVLLLINRITNPVLRLLTGPAEWINWLVVFAPLVTGYMMVHHFLLPYDRLFTLHMRMIEILLVWIPFSRLSHFLFYLFSRTIHGAQFGRRSVSP